jgi:hypothetical protein
VHEWRANEPELDALEAERLDSNPHQPPQTWKWASIAKIVFMPSCWDTQLRMTRRHFFMFSNLGSPSRV